MKKYRVFAFILLLFSAFTLTPAATVTTAARDKLDLIFAEGKDAFYKAIGTILDRHFMKSELDEADLARLLDANEKIPGLFERLMIYAYQKDAPLYEEWARKGDEESLRKFKEKFLGVSQDYAARFVGSLFRKTRLHELAKSLPHNRDQGRLDLVLQSIGFNARNDLPEVPPEKRYSNPIKQDLAAQWAVDAVRARECWPRTKGSGVVVAVLDSGIDPYNTLFKDRLVPGFNFLKRTLPPWEDEGAPMIDYGLHGTGVSSVLLAIAPDCLIMPVRVMDSDTMNDPVFDYWMHEFEAAGIYYAIHHGAQVISISAALHASQPAVAEAVRYAYKKNVIICSSAGNISRSQFGLNPDDAFYRAFDSEVLLIGGVENRDGTFRPWLHTLPNPLVDLSAPSAGIFVLVPSYIPEVKDDYVSGTSLAAPIAAGIVALIRSALPPPAELLAKPAAYSRLVSQCLRETGRLDILDVVEPNDVVGRGLLDAAAALSLMEKRIGSER